jgi:aminopeptidase N
MQLTPNLRVFLLYCSTILLIAQSNAQVLHKARELTHQDTLRGTLNNERTWWDVQRYDISVTPDYDGKTIKGMVDISFIVLSAAAQMQIDLQEPMLLNKAMLNNEAVSFTREGNVFHLSILQQLPINSLQKLQLVFSGKPIEAVRPPWDGGWIFTKDSNGFPWMSVACQGLGASVWYPCKDHQSDEPDKGASLTITVPNDLMAVGNGRLVSTTKQNDGNTSYRWEVKNPINNYNIIPYIGKYISFSESFAGENGPLDCTYWVLQQDLEAAKKQFQQVKPMLQCFEHWFGPYPFYKDGYKLVQAPHLGMEHQSAVAYGNKFKNGYLGRDLSGTGWGLKWDFIIIHESGHEWFGNNITSNDIADMWLHEGFTNYSETIYTQCQSGLSAANEYVAGLRNGIRNDIPIIGIYGVNKEGSGDMYPKSANLIHYIRQIIGDDEKFRTLLRKLNKDFYHSTTSSAVVEAYISKYVGKDLSKLFDQYLRTTQIPVLQYSISKNVLRYRWQNTVAGFDLPVKVKMNGKLIWLNPGTDFKTITTASKNLTVDPNFYVTARTAK